MADVKDHIGSPEAEASEQRTREQLKKASISKTSGDVQSNHTEAMAESETIDVVDINGDKTAEVAAQEMTEEAVHSELTVEPSHTTLRHHTRKRSRDSTAEEELINNGQRKSSERIRVDEDIATTANGAPKASNPARPRTPEQLGEKRGEESVEAMTSPKTKRSRLHVEPEKPTDITASSKEAAPAAGEPKPASAIPPTSGFANASATSPFAALASPKSPTTSAQTSTSAFASSGFGSLANSSTSGFGAIGKPSGGFGAGGSFATSPAKKTDAATKEEPASAFGGSLGQTSVFASAVSPLAGGSGGGFGSAVSGFGGLGQGSAFGGSGFSSLGGIGGLTSFASGKAGPPKTTAKPFGAPPAEGEEAADDEAGDDDAGFKSPLSQESDRQDERFYAQDLETGEEDEKTHYSCRAKLYNFVANEEGKKEWKERGLGTVRLNVKRASTSTTGDLEAQEEGKNEADDESKLRARLLMRAEGSYRVILNTPIKKELKFGTPGGGPPQGGYLYFMGTVEGKQGLEMLQMRVRQQFAMELYEKILTLQKSM